MSVLEEYEKRLGLAALQPDEILRIVEATEQHMARCTEAGIRTTSADEDRVTLWLHDRLQAAYGAMEAAKDVPQLHRCGWCFRAAGLTREAWDALPSMDLDAIQAHAAVCEHNPLVQKIATLEALLKEHGFTRGESE